MSESPKDALRRVADGLGTTDPDIPAIERRGRRRRMRRYGLTALVGFIVVVAVALPLYGLSGMGDGRSPGPTAERASVSMALAKTNGIECTASMPSVVQPGADLGLTMTLTNVSDGPVKVSLAELGYPVRVEAGDQTIWDTTELLSHSWPYIPPRTLDPGESKAPPLEPLAVQFPGSLTVVPTCAGERMPPLHAEVENLGSTPSPEDAVARAVGATSGLFDGCAPGPTRTVVGTVAPPDDPSLSLDVRCAAHMTRAPGFVVVTLVMSTPSSEGPPPVPPGMLVSPDLASDTGNAETLAWRFVVTPTNVWPVASATRTKTVGADAMDTEYEVSSKGWHDGGSSRCGGEGGSMGGNGTWVTISFYNVCI